MSLTPRSRILAVDFGDARTGLAGTDWTGAIVVFASTYYIARRETKLAADAKQVDKPTR